MPILRMSKILKKLKIVTHGSWSWVIPEIFLNFGFRVNSEQLLLRTCFSIFNGKKRYKNNDPWVKVISHI